MATKKKSKQTDFDPDNLPDPPKKKIARQDDLPGMEDRQIKAIHEAALDYAEIRDERQALTQREVETKTKLIDLMHENKKTEYEFGRVSISLTVEKEKVKVRVKKEAEE